MLTFPHEITPKAWRFPRCGLLLPAICLCVAGCTRIGVRVERAPLPPGAPTAEAILTSLAENEAAIRSFTATGKVIVQIPELESTQLLHGSTVYYRSPTDLHVVGRKHGKTVVRLTCVGPAFLLEVPTEKSYYYRPAGERFDTVSSVDIARETFRPEHWRGLPPRRVRMLAYDEGAQTATLEILSKGLHKRPHRRLVVSGAPWVVLENQLLDEDGHVVAFTTKAEYHQQGDIRYPREVFSAFPGENAQLRFTIRTITLNEALDEGFFRLEDRVRALQDKGYTVLERPPRRSPAL